MLAIGSCDIIQQVIDNLCESFLLGFGSLLDLLY